MTQGSPPVRPRFAGCHVPVDPAHRRVRQRCLSEAGRIRGPSPGPCRRYSILVIICCVCRTLLRRLASEEMTAPALQPPARAVSFCTAALCLSFATLAVFLDRTYTLCLHAHANSAQSSK